MILLIWGFVSTLFALLGICFFSWGLAELLELFLGLFSCPRRHRETLTRPLETAMLFSRPPATLERHIMHVFPRPLVESQHGRHLFFWHPGTPRNGIFHSLVVVFGFVFAPPQVQLCVCCDTFSSHLRMANLFFWESKHVLEVVPTSFRPLFLPRTPKHPRFATCPRHVHPGDSLALVPTDSGGCVCVFPGPRLVRPRMWSRSPQLASRCSLQLPRITSRSPVVRLPSPILEALTSLVSCDPRLCVLDTSARQTHRRLGECYRQTGKWCSVFRARA